MQDVFGTRTKTHSLSVPCSQGPEAFLLTSSSPSDPHVTALQAPGAPAQATAIPLDRQTCSTSLSLPLALAASLLYILHGTKQMLPLPHGWDEEDTQSAVSHFV